MVDRNWAGGGPARGHAGPGTWVGLGCTQLVAAKAPHLGTLVVVPKKGIMVQKRLGTSVLEEAGLSPYT